MVVGPASERPAVFPVRLRDRQVVDARVASAHEDRPRRIPSSRCRRNGTSCRNRRAIRRRSAPRCDCLGERPHFLDQPIVEFASSTCAAGIARWRRGPRRTRRDFATRCPACRPARRGRGRGSSSASSAARTFWRAVSRLKGGSGGRVSMMWSPLASEEEKVTRALPSRKAATHSPARDRQSSRPLLAIRNARVYTKICLRQFGANISRVSPSRESRDRSWGHSRPTCFHGYPLEPNQSIACCMRADVVAASSGGRCRATTHIRTARRNPSRLSRGLHGALPWCITGWCRRACLPERQRGKTFARLPEGTGFARRRRHCVAPGFRRAAVSRRTLLRGRTPSAAIQVLQRCINHK